MIEFIWFRIVDHFRKCLKISNIVGTLSFFRSIVVVPTLNTLWPSVGINLAFHSVNFSSPPLTLNRDQSRHSHPNKSLFLEKPRNNATAIQSSTKYSNPYETTPGTCSCSIWKTKNSQTEKKQKGIFNILYKLVLNYCLEKRVADKKETKKKPRKKGRK